MPEPLALTDDDEKIEWPSIEELSSLMDDCERVSHDAKKRAIAMA